MILPEYVGEGPDEKKKRFDRFVEYVDRTVTRGNRVKAVEAASFIVHSREVGALTDDLTAQLLARVTAKFSGGEYDERQGSLFD